MTLPFDELLRRVVDERMRYIDENRELLVEAWIAETGLRPSESRLVVQDMEDGRVRYWVEKRDA